MSLSVETGGRQFAFIFTIGMPEETLVALLEFFINRNIKMDELHLQHLQGKSARLTIHCRMERDRIRHTINLMEKMKGIIELEWLESRGMGNFY